MNPVRIVLPALLGLLALPARADEAPAQDLASLLPADTLIVLEGDDLGGADVWRRETALGRIWSEPEVQQFVQGLAASCTQAAERMQASGSSPLALVGLKWTDFTGIRIRSGGFALVDYDPRSPAQADVVFTLRFRDGAESATRILVAMRQAAAAFAGIEFRETEVAGSKVWQANVGPVSLHVRMAGDRLLVTTRRERMEQVLAALDGRNPSPLAASPRFVRAVERLGAQRRGLLGWFDVPGLVARVQRLDRRWVGRFTDAWRKLGCDAIEAVACADVPSGTGFRSELVVLLSERRGLFGMFEPGTVNHRFARHVPAGALAYCGERFDLGAFVRDVVALAGTFDANAPEHVRQFYAHVRERIGVDLENEVFGALGVDWATYVGAPPGGGLVPDLACFASVKDRPRLERALSRAVEGLAPIVQEHHGVRMTLRESHFRGVTIHSVELCTRRGDAIPFAPSWAFADDFVVGALCPATIRNALVEKPSLGGNEDFRARLREVPSSATTCTYVDTKGLVTWLYNTVVPMLQGAQGALNRKLLPYGIVVNFGDLPPASAIASHLTGTVFYGAVDPDGVRLGCVSPFGAAAAAFPVFAAAGVAGLGGMVARPVARDVREIRVAPEVEPRAHARLKEENARLRARLADIERQIEELRRLVQEQEPRREEERERR